MHNARGLATGDYNNDGRIDVLVGVNGGAPLLLRNQAGGANEWVGVKLVGKSCNRDAVGARISWLAGNKLRSVLKTGGGSYLSSHDQRVVLGLGTAQKAEWIEVQWPRPSSRVERFQPPPGRYSTLVEGEGESAGAK
ncbi:MAG: CRTAC1 family protein [Bryobacteraceae bacterium]